MFLLFRTRDSSGRLFRARATQPVIARHFGPCVVAPEEPPATQLRIEHVEASSAQSRGQADQSERLFLQNVHTICLAAEAPLRRLQHAHVHMSPHMHRASRNPIHRHRNWGLRLNLSLSHDRLDQRSPVVSVHAKPLTSIVYKASMFEGIVVSADPFVNHFGIDVLAQANDQAAQPRATLRAREAELSCGNHTWGKLRTARRWTVPCHGAVGASATASISDCVMAKGITVRWSFKAKKVVPAIREAHIWQEFPQPHLCNMSGFSVRRRVADSNNSTRALYDGVVGTDTACLHEASEVSSLAANMR